MKQKINNNKIVVEVIYSCLKYLLPKEKNTQ